MKSKMMHDSAKGDHAKGMNHMEGHQVPCKTYPTDRAKPVRELGMSEHAGRTKGAK
jgi:hypothetical protein